MFHYKCNWCKNEIELNVNTDELLMCPICSKKQLKKHKSSMTEEDHIKTYKKEYYLAMRTCVQRCLDLIEDNANAKIVKFELSKLVNYIADDLPKRDLLQNTIQYYPDLDYLRLINTVIHHFNPDEYITLANYHYKPRSTWLVKRSIINE